MPAPVAVLLTGLDFDWTRRNSPAVDIDTLSAQLRETFNQLKAVEGLSLKIYQVKPDEQATIKDWKSLVERGPEAGGKWDAVMFGGGIRTPPMIPLFEELLNFVRETTPGSKMLFSSTTTDHLVSIKRNFSQL